MSTLEKAIALAATQHAGQLDKGGQPYILHPLRLMLQFSNPTLQIVCSLCSIHHHFLIKPIVAQMDIVNVKRFR
jgi:(p)ppGpp synthase/HD superfamily hydrolase